MLRPRSKGLLHRLVDEEETAQFPKYAALLAAESGPLVERLPGKQKRAREYLDSLLPLGEEMRTEFKKLIAEFPQDDLKILRCEGQVEPQVLHMIGRTAARWTRVGLAHAGIGEMPRREDVKFSLPFRVAVCQAALLLHWARKSGLDSRPPEKLRNDMMDCAVSAYATFFDGLLTHDSTLREVHNFARALLRGPFKVAIA